MARIPFKPCVGIINREEGRRMEAEEGRRASSRQRYREKLEFGREKEWSPRYEESKTNIT